MATCYPLCVSSSLSLSLSVFFLFKSMLNKKPGHLLPSVCFPFSICAHKSMIKHQIPTKVQGPNRTLRYPLRNKARPTNAGQTNRASSLWLDTWQVCRKQHRYQRLYQRPQVAHASLWLVDPLELPSSVDCCSTVTNDPYLPMSS